MADFLNQASDDQIAVGLCLGAVLVSGLIMHFSHYVGRLGRNAGPGLSDHLRSSSLPAHSLRSAPEAPRERRERAA